MPNDLFRWEDGGGLVHHCPICHTPLSHAKSKRVCLGNHVEWCSRYHCQLFRKGWSNECAPCRHSEKQHDKRHREIADLLHQLKSLENEILETPKTPKTPNLGLPDQQVASPSLLCKRERKAAKNSAKAAAKVKVVSMGDIILVSKALHPNDCEKHGKNEAGEERKLLLDPEIKSNMFFHKGTSNTGYVRHELVVKGREKRREPEVDPAELDAIMEALEVKQAGSAKSQEKRNLIGAIRTAVEADLINVGKEKQQTMMRKGGFWRWASKKGYKRLVDNGMLWDEKGLSQDGVAERKESAVDNEDVQTGTPDPASRGSAENQDRSDASSRSDSVSSDPSVSSKSSIEEDVSWTQIGKAVKAKTPLVSRIKLSGNGGLSKLKVAPKGTKFGALTLQPDS